MTDIMTPALGESVTEATVARWAKKPGEAVAKDEVLVELETDKVNLEAAATEDGVLADITAPGAAAGPPRRRRPPARPRARPQRRPPARSPPQRRSPRPQPPRPSRPPPR